MIALAVSLAVAALAANVKQTVTEYSDGLDLTVKVMPCGEVNAWYWPQSHELDVCTELADLPPSVQRFIVMHEMGHAYIDQYDLPITGSEEAAADEFAAVVLSATGHQSDVLNAALWMRELPDQTEHVQDDHQSKAKRAWELVCIEDGSEEHPMIAECQQRFQRAVHSWARLLAHRGDE